MPEQPKKILIVEDEQNLRQELAAQCNSDGFITFEAKNGEEGLSFALREHPDLILLDLVMPAMNGVEMLQQLRKDEWGKNAVVVVLTNYDDADRVADVLGAGVYDYVLKSDFLKDIMEHIRKKLELN